MAELPGGHLEAEFQNTEFAKDSNDRWPFMSNCKPHNVVRNEQSVTNLSRENLVQEISEVMSETQMEADMNVTQYQAGSFWQDVSVMGDSQNNREKNKEKKRKEEEAKLAGKAKEEEDEKQRREAVKKNIKIILISWCSIARRSWMT